MAGSAPSLRDPNKGRDLLAFRVFGWLRVFCSPGFWPIAGASGMMRVMPVHATEPAPIASARFDDLDLDRDEDRVEWRRRLRELATARLACVRWNRSPRTRRQQRQVVSTTTEPAATSQLVAWSGVEFDSTRVAEGGQGVPVYYQGGTTDLKNCLAWTESSEAIITTPIGLAQQTGALEKLTYQLDYVGAFTGFGVDAPPGAKVIATEPVSGANMAAARCPQ